MIINSFHAEIGNRFFPFKNFINTGDMPILQITGIRRSSVRINRTLPAIHKVLCCDWRAIRPFRIFTQMEGPDFRVFIIPGFSDARCWMTVKIADQ
ncbi:Uncharacterised protein [Shigella sonnei]|nr:Uncharacterised protein [Shigella sonnei]